MLTPACHSHSHEPTGSDTGAEFFPVFFDRALATQKVKTKQLAPKLTLTEYREVEQLAISNCLKA